MGEHHTPGTDPQRFGRLGDVTDEDLWRRSGEPKGVVVLGNPIAVIAEGLGAYGKIDRVAQCVARAGSGGDRGLVEDRETHAASLAWRARQGEIGSARSAHPTSTRVVGARSFGDPCRRET